MSLILLLTSLKSFKRVAYIMFKSFSFLQKFSNAKKSLILSPDEKEILLKTWNHDFEFLFSLGANIFVYLFEVHPKIKDAFPKLKGVDNWYESEDFRGPILRAVKALTTFLENIDDVSVVVPALYEIGKGHTRHIPYGFRAEYWDLFHQALCITLNEHLTKLDMPIEKREYAIKTWAKVVDFIIIHLKRGFLANLPSGYKVT